MGLWSRYKLNRAVIPLWVGLYMIEGRDNVTQL